MNLVCRYQGYGRGLALHQKRMHWAAEERVGFSCKRYGIGMETEGAKVNHQKNCAERREEGVRMECRNCGYWIAVGNYFRHDRRCLREIRWVGGEYG